MLIYNLVELSGCANGGCKTSFTAYDWSCSGTTKPVLQVWSVHVLKG